MKISEQRIKNQIVQLFKHDQFYQLFPIKNMGTARTDRFGKLFYTRGAMVNGIADLVGLTAKGRFIAVETKTKSGLVKFLKEKTIPKTTAWYEFQWGEEVKRNGGIYILATDPEECRRDLSKALRDKCNELDHAKAETNLGNCYNRYSCDICGISYTIDSSD